MSLIHYRQPESLADPGGPSSRWPNFIALIFGGTSVTACVVGPDYRVPPSIDRGSGSPRPDAKGVAE